MSRAHITLPTLTPSLNAGPISPNGLPRPTRVSTSDQETQFNMPGHIEDDAIVGAELVAAAQDAERKASIEVQKQRDSDALPVADKDFDGLGHGLEDFPSEEEIHTLRRVAAHIPPKLFTIAFIELCERFSYYGTVIVVCVLPRDRLT